MAVTTNLDDPLGSIVAFEGHPETISTQLRLLPTSPDILVLPAIQCYLPDEKPNDTFTAHSFIRKAHDAVLARNEAARAFIQSPAGTGTRLVFMSGGTPSVQALCIREIMKYETDGDDEKAEVKFDFLVREGIAGLISQSKKWSENERLKLAALDHTSSGAGQRVDGKRTDFASQGLTLAQLDEDPITRAMRAAEALDRQTGYLQPSTELDLTLSSRPRSTSLPMYGYSDGFGDAAPFYVFGASNRSREEGDPSSGDAGDDGMTDRITMAPNFAVTHYDDTLDPSLMEAPNSPSCTGESYGPTFLHSPLPVLSTPKSDRLDTRSPADVVFGEAALVDIRMPGRKSPVLRVRSLDRICPSSPMRNSSSSSESEEDPSQSRRAARPHSLMTVRSNHDTRTKRLTLTDRPRTITVRAKQTIDVTLAPVPRAKRKKQAPATYVDRGTDADLPEDEGTHEYLGPVFPMTEDFVIYFKENSVDILLDLVIRGFKNGTYPIHCQSADSSETDTVHDHLPRTPKSTSTVGADNTPRARSLDEDAAEIPTFAADDYDPFAYSQTGWVPKQSQPTATVSSTRVTKIEVPPTPDKTPAPSVASQDHKFHEFGINRDDTAVKIQNSLRSVLNVHFPPDADGFQLQFSFLPELEGLWKPIFREAEPESPRSNNHRMDQILAIGSQQGVSREYSSRIIGMLSKLGLKDNGVSRGGRLDLRYLLANAMQAFTAQPLTNQASDNPFGNPYLLATLIVPHLETYLALHSEVRFLLLEYPPQHLPTILALQKLVGVELMKVAQIVDAKSGDLGAFKHIRGASITRNIENSGHLGKPSCPDITVSKANFLLTSSANDSEVDTFISTMRKILMDISLFYHDDTAIPSIPSLPSQEQSTRRAKPPPLTSRFSAFPKPNGLQSPTTLGATLASPSPTVSRPPSVAETVKTFKSARTARSRKSRRRPPTADGGESIMTYDPAEDSDYDFEERRLMPIFLQKKSRRPKPNSRKALKFLGLA